MREAYRVVQRGVFNLDIIFKNSVKYRLDQIANVFSQEAAVLDKQSSLKTIIIP
jgi:hypothetical protein